MKLDVRSTDVVLGDLGKIPDHDPIAEYLDYRPDEDGDFDDGDDEEHGGDKG